MKNDVVVVGSGAAGLTAGLAASRGGATVTVIEKSAMFGGTTTFSGGSMWVPNNRFMSALGLDDSREEALTYIRRLTLGRVPDKLVETYVDECNNTVSFLQSETNLEYGANTHHPDYHPEFPGAKFKGRTVQAHLFDTNRLGELKDSIRMGYASLPVTLFEADEWGRSRFDLAKWDFNMLAERMEAGLVAGGRGLIGELLEACLKRGVKLIRETRAVRLMRDGGRVIGVKALQNGSAVQLEGRLGVVLASAGFEWNKTLVDRFLGVPLAAPSSPPTNVGDGLLMAMEAGAALGNMTEAWWGPTINIPGEKYEDGPLNRNTNEMRGLPGCIIVNRLGKRFVDEAANYNDMSKAMAHFDPVAFDYANLPAYLVMDGGFRKTYAIATLMPDRPTPSWLIHGETLKDLAQQLGIDADGLTAEIAEFNEHAGRGEDPKFLRGKSAYDRFRGDQTVQPNPNLRPMGEGPYYGMEIRMGCIGTKGGPVIDEHGRVLDAYGEPISGLYGSGNVVANVFGPGYPGAGATIGSGTTFGLLAGKALTSNG